ncbi:hemagglutinin repeat-containing protein [Xanthomonas campestris]|uniref:hemagglutinin repeat-containing protein n=2 Tax=Xanthomonas campestris TaxID=339 RepID=UPI002B236AE5|nr:hemagglutinin repeat-containing protein [Xanthomonas campestris]
MIDLINNVDDARKSDGRLSTMQNMAAAANAYQSVKAAKSGTILSIEAGVGFATSESSFNSNSQTSLGSTITGGGNVSLKTTEGDLHIVQGNIKAGDTLSLDSARDLVLEAGQSVGSEQSKGSNAGFEVGVGAQIGAQTGVYAYVQASAGSHNSNAQSTTWENTQLAGKNVVLTSKGDTTLRGAVVTADRIDANVGGDLTIESLQDVSQIQSKESSVGGRVQVSFGTAWDASGYANSAKANGNYLGVTQQSGLFAGDGGYHVTAGNVNLIGGAITSTNANNSELTADSLTFTDLKNRMDYSTSSATISGGIGSTGEGATDADGNPTQPSVGDQFRNIGSNIVNGNYGEANYGSFNPGIPITQSGSATTLTRATLTEGNIKIGGKTTTAAATGINTDASAAHEAVAALPDVRKILGEQQAMAAATGTVVSTAKQIGDDIAAAAESKANAIEAQYIKGLDTQEKVDAFNALTADQRRDVFTQSNPEYSAAYESKQHWGVGGDYSRALQAVTTVVVGGVSGQGAGQVATNALAPYAAQLIGRTFDPNHGSNPNAALQLVSHAVLGAVLAEVNGASVTGGALAGASGELAAQHLTLALYRDDPRAYGPDGKFDPNRLPEADKQTIVALSQAVGALVSGIAGGDLRNASLGGAIAGNAVENNRMLADAEINRIKTLGNGDPQKEARLTIAACALVKCSAQYADGSEEKKFWAAIEEKGTTSEYAQERILLESQTDKNYGSLLASKTGRAPSQNIFDYGFSDYVADGATKLDNENGNPFARLGGLLQATGGITAIASGSAGCLETGVSCLLVPWGIDQTIAGTRTAATGEWTSTFGGMLLSKTGLPTPYAEALYALVGASPLATVKKIDINVWELPPTKRGIEIESSLAKADYSPTNGWYRIGSEKNGYFPLVDFQKGNTLVSLKTVDTGGASWPSRMESTIDDLASNSATVNGQPARMVLDLRVQPGGLKDAARLIDYGKRQGITVIIREFP